MFLFLFSSRRRHTRWPRDWSSDVCSSDLELHFDRNASFAFTSITSSSVHIERKMFRLETHQFTGFLFGKQSSYIIISRSEERRVGKSVDIVVRRMTNKRRESQNKVSTDTD